MLISVNKLLYRSKVWCHGSKERHLKSSDAKASKCHLKFSFTELKYTSLIKMIILEENFKWHLEAFASELFIYNFTEQNNCFQR